MAKLISRDFLFVGLLITTLFVGLFSVDIISISLIVLFIYWFFFEKEFSKFSNRFSVLWPYWLYVMLFILGFVFSSDKGTAIKHLERIISFAIVPLIFICSKWNINRTELFANLVINTTIGISLYSIILILNFTITKYDFVLTMDETYLQWKLPHLAGFHPTYFGNFIVVATIFLFMKMDKTDSLKAMALIIFKILFLTGFLLYLSPRSAIICQILVLSYMFYDFLHKRISLSKKRSLMLVFLFFIIVLIYSLKFSSYFISKFSRFLSDDRFFLWPLAYECIKNNYFLLGEGLLSGKKSCLNDALLTVNDTRVYYKGMDVHNQYIKNYLQLGLAGFLSLLLLILRPILYFRNKYLILFMVAFSIAIFTESMLSIIKGIIFFNFISLFFIVKLYLMNNDEKKDPKEERISK